MSISQLLRLACVSALCLAAACRVGSPGPAFAELTARSIRVRVYHRPLQRTPVLTARFVDSLGAPLRWGTVVVDSTAPAGGAARRLNGLARHVLAPGRWQLRGESPDLPPGYRKPAWAYNSYFASAPVALALAAGDSVAVLCTFHYPTSSVRHEPAILPPPPEPEVMEFPSPPRLRKATSKPKQRNPARFPHQP